jgi:hypothetical protein
MRKIDLEDICLWPDGEWCYVEELEPDFQHKSDDFRIIHLGTDAHTFIVTEGYLDEGA